MSSTLSIASHKKRGSLMHCITVVVCVDIHGHIIWVTFERIKFIILIVLETRITAVVHTKIT